MVKLSVIIPSYNEVKNLQKGVLEEVWQYLQHQDYSFEVIIADDGSKDRSVELVKEIIKDRKGFSILHLSHSGKALTVIRGMLQAQGQAVLFTDMDQATPINQVDKLLKKLDEGFDIVIGSRTGRKGAPLLRQISAFGFSALRNIILGLPFQDTQCGFKLFSSDAVERIFPKLESIWQKKLSKGSAVNAGFDIELLFLAKRMNFKIAEVPIEWRYVDTERVQFIKDGIEAVKDILRIKINSLLGSYD